MSAVDIIVERRRCFCAAPAAEEARRGLTAALMLAAPGLMALSKLAATVLFRRMLVTLAGVVSVARFSTS